MADTDDKENTKACPDCGGILGPEEPLMYEDTWCKYCQYTFHDCEVCGKVFEEEVDAGDCCV